MINFIQISQLIVNIEILTFVVASIAALGLSLTVGQIYPTASQRLLVAKTLLVSSLPLLHADRSPLRPKLDATRHQTPHETCYRIPVTMRNSLPESILAFDPIL